MIRVTVSYPQKSGSRFDFDYYLKSHIPMVQRLLDGTLRKVEVFKGAGAPGGDAPANVCVAALFFDSTDAFDQAFGPVAGEVMADVRNYTDIEPIVQIEEQLV
jgi:uncharacterized protein (TIGR02118 family)